MMNITIAAELEQRIVLVHAEELLLLLTGKVEIVQRHCDAGLALHSEQVAHNVRQRGLPASLQLSVKTAANKYVQYKKDA